MNHRTIWKKSTNEQNSPYIYILLYASPIHACRKTHRQCGEDDDKTWRLPGRRGSPGWRVAIPARASAPTCQPPSPPTPTLLRDNSAWTKIVWPAPEGCRCADDRSSPLPRPSPSSPPPPRSPNDLAVRAPASRAGPEAARIALAISTSHARSSSPSGRLRARVVHARSSRSANPCPVHPRFHGPPTPRSRHNHAVDPLEGSVQPCRSSLPRCNTRAGWLLLFSNRNTTTCHASPRFICQGISNPFQPLFAPLFTTGLPRDRSFTTILVPGKFLDLEFRRMVNLATRCCWWVLERGNDGKDGFSFFLFFFVRIRRIWRNSWREVGSNLTKFHIDNKRWLLRYRPLWMDSSLRHRVNYICIPFRNLSDLKKFFTPFENESNFIPPEFFSNYVHSRRICELNYVILRVELLYLDIFLSMLILVQCWMLSLETFLSTDTCATYLAVILYITEKFHSTLF